MQAIDAIWRFLNKPKTAAWVFILPTIITLMVFLFIPLVAAIVMSLYDINIFLTDITFVGLNNYRELLQDSRFWNSFFNTLYYVVLAVPLGVIVSLLAALYVARTDFFHRSIRTIFYIPVICSMTAVSIIWGILLDPIIGVIPQWTRQLGIGDFLWLNDPDMAMPLVVVMSVWKTFGLQMLIFVAGLMGIPKDYYEAAAIDGANKVQQFFRVTLPLIIPTLGFCVVTGTIGSFMVFDQIYVLTGGGPMFRTETIAAYIYWRGFSSPFRLGYASAISQGLFFMIAVVALLQYKFFLKRETETG